MPVKITLDAHELELIVQAIECGIEHGKPFSSDAKALRELCGHFRTMAKKDRLENKLERAQFESAFWYEVTDRRHRLVPHYHLFDDLAKRDAFYNALSPKARARVDTVHRSWPGYAITAGISNGTVTIHA